MLIYKELRDRATAGDQILDVGTKNGRHLEGVAGHVVAVDLEIDPSVASVEYVTADGYSLPFESGVFDYVICNQVLEHVKDKGSLVDEIQRVLSPDGLLLISFPNRLFPLDPHGFPPGFPLLPRQIALKISKSFLQDRYKYYRDQVYYISAFTGRYILSERFGDVEYATLDLLDRYPDTYRGSILGRLLLALHPLINMMTMTTIGRTLFEAGFGYASYRCRMMNSDS